jgi:hypothetical protein
MKNIIPFIILAAFILFACEKKNTTDNQSPLVKEKISGVSQKGPFINGSSLTIFELDETFTQTGKSFNTQIKDNLGSFELNSISLLTHYAKLRADGFYFNEISNFNSLASLTLYALSDLSDKSIVNINLMTNLEISRVEYLLNNGYTFAEAKNQAQQEILNIFSIKKTDIAESELLDITKSSDDDAILLAVSVILQGFRSEADLTQLMGEINTDIRSDGILNDSVTGSKLINEARLLNLEQIRSNMTTKFQELGINVAIPDFEKYVKIFLDSSVYIITNNIVYPEFSNYGENILYGDKDTFRLHQDYSMAANLPAGSSVKIIIKYDYPEWGFSIEPDGPVNWTIGSFDDANDQQIIESTKDGINCDLKINFYVGPGPVTPIIEYYENNSTAPQKIKHIYVY